MIPTYNAIFDAENNKGVFGISLVESPAMEGLFVALAKQEQIQLKEVDKDQRILMGLVLEPNKAVYRNQDGKEFNIVFSEDTIKELSHNFFKSGFQLNSKLEHSDNIEDISFVESWIVHDPKIDKSTNFGMEYPKGSWLVSMKVDNDEIWNDYVKTGKIKGFSIDAMLSFEKVETNLKTEIEMSEVKNKGIIEQIKEILLGKDEVKEEVKLASIKSGEIDIFFEGESLEVDGAVWVQGEGEEKVALPVGTYELEDMRVLVVEQDGVVARVEAKAEEVKEEAKEEMETETPKDPYGQIKQLIAKFSEDNKLELSKIIERLEKVELSNTEVKSENEKLKKENVELSKEPAAKPISTGAKKIEFKDMTNFQKLKYNEENGLR